MEFGASDRIKIIPGEMMNRITLISFAIISSINMTLAIIASLIFTMDSIYLIWIFPPILLLFSAVAFFVCKYMLINKAEYQKMDNFVARFNPIAAFPNMASYRPNLILIGTSIFLFLFSFLLFVGAITPK